MNVINDSKSPDGSESRNRLIAARSPYLLQHAQNPVHWYEWGSEAFDKASKDNLPVFLSIGYATCHWCHVMAHESFDDNEVAVLLNRHFVCIKVDREERPDIDDFYMTVSQVMTGSGGWPLNIFMKADKHPFMAFTYLPKHRRNGMSGFMDLLSNITLLWQQRSDMIESNCTGIIKAIADIGRQKPKEDLTLSELSRKALHQLTGLFDDECGGFGRAPKFPMPIYLSWLIEQGSYGNRHADSMALKTLRKIRFGGIWDHLGGGLHRYSTDREWLAPHFEKMLYDQALMALVALEAFQCSNDELFLQIAADIFEFAERELALPEGAYCSALDADSEGVEGKYYLWDKREVDECLGSDSSVFCRFYDVSDEGNFEGHSILNMPSELQDFCARDGLDQSEIEQT
ncbi:MAG: thioredoxin domain-containing protein, partial [Deltaproteobacteria bacterium]